MTIANAELGSKKKASDASAVETAMDDLTMVSLLWMGASANAVRHHLPKGIGRVHTMGAEDDDGD